MAPKKLVKEADKQGVRERLLRAALDIFNERGYASTSVREIVEAAGVTKPVLYYYFKNKEGIYVELISKPFEVLEVILTEALHETLSARERVQQLFSHIFQLFVDNLKVARLMYSIFYGPPQGAPFFDFEGCHLKIRELTGLIVREGIHNGEFSAPDEDSLAWVLMGALNFALEEQLCQHSPMIDRQGLSRMLDMIFDGLARTGDKTRGELT